MLPLTWRHYEHQHALAGLTMVTRTASGIPGDPINVGLVGSREDVLCAMNAAGWDPADPITLRSSIEIVGSVLLDRPYRNAPVSHLYYNNKRQDLAFEKPVGTAPTGATMCASGACSNTARKAARSGSARRRSTAASASVTTTAASPITSRPTSMPIAISSPRISRPRKSCQTIYEVTGIGPTIAGRNGEGDPYYTDGEIKISVLVAGCNQRSAAVAVLDNPPLVNFKNLAWDSIAKTILSATVPGVKTNGGTAR